MPVTTVPDISPVVLNGEVPLSSAVLTINLPAGPYTDFSRCIASLNNDPVASSNLPDGIPDEDGDTAATASLTLAGFVDETDESKTVVWLFNPDNPDSPMFRQQAKGSIVTLDLGVPVDGADVLVRQFTMVVSAVDEIDHAGGTVKLSLAEPTDDFNSSNPLSAVLTAPPYNAGLTSEFVLDRIARAGSKPRYTWPLPRMDCRLAVGMRTSLWAEVGSFLSNNSDYPPSFAPSAFGSGLNELFGGTDTSTQQATYQLASPITDDGSAVDFTVEFWVSNMASGPGVVEVTGSSDQAGWDVSLNAVPNINDIEVSFTTSTGARRLYSVSYAWDDATHFVGVHFHFAAGGGSAKITVRIDDTTHTSGSLSYAGTPFGTTGFTEADVSIAGDPANNANNPTFCAWLIHSEALPTTWNDTFTPTALLDPSLNPMQAVPAIAADADRWSEMQRLVQAEAGFLYLDGNSNLVFKNRDSIDSQTAWRAFTSDQSIETLFTGLGASTLYQRVGVDWTDYTFKSKQTILQPTGQWHVPAHSTGDSAVSWTRKITDGQTAAQVSSPAIPWTTDAAPPPSATGGQSYYRASLDRYGGQGEHPYNTLTITAVLDTPSQITVTAENSGSRDAWLTDPDSYLNTSTGDAALWIRGTLVIADDPNTLYVATRDKTPTFTFDSNSYRQDRDAAKALAQWLLGQTYAPYPEYSQVALMFDPRLEVGDRITLTDPDVSLVQTDVLVWGKHISIEASEGGGLDVSMTCDVRPTTRPGSAVVGASVVGPDAYVY